MAAFVRWLARAPIQWLASVVVLCLIAAWLGTRLELRADLLSMLPEDVPAARAYRIFLEEFGGMEQVFVVITPGTAGQEGGSAAADQEEPRERNRAQEDRQQKDLEQKVLEVALRLEERLVADPLIATVRAGLQPEDEEFFFEYVVPRTVLRDLSWTKERISARLQPAAIAERVDALRRKIRNPLGELEVRLARYDPLGFSEGLLASQGSGLALTVDPLSGVFQSASGAALLILEPTVSELDATAGRSLADSLAKHFEAIGSGELGGVDIAAVGGPLYAAADEKLIRSDLEGTISLSIAGCLLVLLLAFGSWRATVVAAAVLAAAFSLAFGTLQVVRGEMLAVSLGFSAVLIGLGIDYVIHAVTRYRQGLDYGRSCEQSLLDVYYDTAPALLGSALTTASAFAILLASAMRPLVEIGLLVSVGIVSMLLCTVVVGGPLMVLLVKASPWVSSQQSGSRAARYEWLQVLWRPAGTLPLTMMGFARRRPWLVLALAMMALLISVWSARDLRFSPRFEDLRPDDHPLETAERLLASEFGFGEDTATILVHGATKDQALDRARWVTEGLTVSQGVLRGIEITVSSPSSVLMSSSSMRSRIEALAGLDWTAAADELERRMPEAGLSPQGFTAGLEALRSLGQGMEPAGGKSAVRPDWIRTQLATRGSGEAVVALRVRTDPKGSRLLATEEAVAELRTLILEREGLAGGGESTTRATVSIASAVALGEQMRGVGEREVGLLAAASLGVVLLFVAVVLGLSPVATGLALLPILFGAAVAFGVLAATAGRLDFLSLAIVPMLFGIGIDDGLHALSGGWRSRFGDGHEQRWSGWSKAGRRRRLAEIPERVEHASRAITLTTLTTVVGFGSLAFSSMPGLRNGGVIVAVGVVACWLTTILVLPALVQVLWGQPDGPASPLTRTPPTAAGRFSGSKNDETNLPAKALPPGASHAPKVSRLWMKRLGFLHFSSPFWYRMHAILMRRLPSWAISALMAPLLVIFFLMLGNVRRALVTNRRAVQGPSRWGPLGDLARGFQNLYQYGWCFCETYEGLFDPTTRTLSLVVGEENWLAVTGEGELAASSGSAEATHLAEPDRLTSALRTSSAHKAGVIEGACDSRLSPGEQAMVEKQGFVIATAHVGHWEVGSHLSKFERPRKVHVVREPEMNPESQTFLEELFARGGDAHYQVHFARPEDPMLGGRLLSALRRGEIVALQGDRPRAGGKALAVKLFSRPFTLPVGPFAMARAAAVPILPVFVFREGRRRSELHLREPIVVSRTRDRNADLQDAARSFAKQIEWAVNKRPDQWFCLRTLWPTD